MERCKNCGAALFGDEYDCPFCGTSVTGRQKYTPETYNERRFEENFNEYHETIDCECEKPVTKENSMFSDSNKEQADKKPDSVGKVVLTGLLGVFFIFFLMAFFLFISFMF